VILSLIGSTKTASGLQVECVVDEGDYPTGAKVTDEELDAVNIVRHAFHGEWNYDVLPKKPIS
jgi:hypothetical protein